MLRRSLAINLIFSVISTMMFASAMKNATNIGERASRYFSAYAQNSALLSPLVHRTLSVR